MHTSVSLTCLSCECVFRDAADTNYEGLLHKTDHGAAASELKEAPDSSSALDETRNNVVEDDSHVQLGRKEVVSVPAPCPSCHAMGESLTALTDIPHFKEVRAEMLCLLFWLKKKRFPQVIIFAFTCSECGFKDSEIRAGGAVPTLGASL
jgi:hypothetical protein